MHIKVLVVRDPRERAAQAQAAVAACRELPERSWLPVSQS